LRGPLLTTDRDSRFGDRIPIPPRYLEVLREPKDRRILSATSRAAEAVSCPLRTNRDALYEG
jgi:hypothetical protein